MHDGGGQEVNDSGATAATLPAPAIATNQPIDRDLSCRGCGYNLRGLQPEASCPECNQPVASSLISDLLADANPRWVRRLAKGARLMLGSQVGFVALYWGRRFAGSALDDALFAWQAAYFAIAVYECLGAWWITQRDPSGLGEERYGTLRKVARATIFVGVGQSIFDIWLTVEPTTVALVTGYVTLRVAELVRLVALLLYLRRLALRVPDPWTSRLAHLCTFGLGIPHLIQSGMTLYVAYDAGAGSFFPSELYMSIYSSAGACLVVFGAVMLLMFFRLNRIVWKQATLAERAWRATSVTPAPLPSVA